MTVALTANGRLPFHLREPPGPGPPTRATASGRTLPFRGEGEEGPKSPHRAVSGRLPQPVDADLALRWTGSASETTMTTEHSIPARQRVPWTEDA